MSYDSDDAGATRLAGPAVEVSPGDPRDREVLTELLGFAAIMLSPSFGAVFTADQLIDEAVRLGGPECPVRPSDLRIVLATFRDVQRVPGGYTLR